MEEKDTVKELGVHVLKARMWNGVDMDNQNTQKASEVRKQQPASRGSEQVQVGGQRTREGAGTS